MLRHHRDRAIVVLGAVVALVLMADVLAIGTGLPAQAHATVRTITRRHSFTAAVALNPPFSAAPPTTVRSTPPAVATAPQPVPFPTLAVPSEVTLASPRGTIPTFATPGGAAMGSVGSWYGAALTLPAIGAQPGWLEVRLPWRPNGSTAWVHDYDVSLSSTSYFIVVSLSATQLVLYQAGHPIYDLPAGLGLPATPTPTGQFFVAIHESHPSTFYGPVVLDTSAHSEALRGFDGQNDAIIAVHGPISASADRRIGSTGARVSNGCIRLHNADLAKLAVVPAGTPIAIIP